eukprot:GHVR01147043.1.p1 GENE.GHVR01147043.1~~GHVR01147043.1.p1  ORF type:complete len:557 (+),score=177.20 GHVR01147043.1:170-1840(+)
MYVTRWVNNSRMLRVSMLRVAYTLSHYTLTRPYVSTSTSLYRVFPFKQDDYMKRGSTIRHTWRLWDYLIPCTVTVGGILYFVHKYKDMQYMMMMMIGEEDRGGGNSSGSSSGIVACSASIDPPPIETESHRLGVSQYTANYSIEDRYSIAEIVVNGERALVASVIDGHGGSIVAEYVKRRISHAVRECLTGKMDGVSTINEDNLKFDICINDPEVVTLTPINKYSKNNKNNKNIKNKDEDTISEASTSATEFDNNNTHTHTHTHTHTNIILNDIKTNIIGKGKLLKNTTIECMCMCMRNTFNIIDTELNILIRKSIKSLQIKNGKVGACCVTVLVDSDHIIVANCGDCKAVLCRGGKAIPLSTEHSANQESEQERLRREHPGESDVVVCRGTHKQEVPCKGWWGSLWGMKDTVDVPSACYVKGRLMPTRTFGDFHLKTEDMAVDATRVLVQPPYSFPYITAEPEVKTYTRHAKDQFILLASDGVWDFFNDTQAVEHVKKALKIHKNDPQAAADSLVEEIIAKAASECGRTVESLKEVPLGKRRSLHDDITAVVVLL